MIPARTPCRDGRALGAVRSGTGATLSIPDTPAPVNALVPEVLRKIVGSRDLQLGPPRAMPCRMEPATPENPPSPAPQGVPLAPGVRVASSAIVLSFVRASGPGGQNVNKRATKCQLRIRLDDIPLTDAARARLIALAGSLLTDSGDLIIQDDSTRSQARNRDACLDRLRELVARALVAPKKRRPTKPSRGAVQRRIDDKKRRGESKQRRRPPDD